MSEVEDDPNPSGHKIVVAATLRRTAQAWWTTGAPCFALALLVRGPLMLWAALGPDSSAVASRGGVWAAAALAGFVVDLLAPTVLAGAVTYAVIRHLEGQPSSLGRSVLIGLRACLPACLVGIVTLLLTLAGCCAFVVPGLVALAIYSIAVPCAVVERLGLRATLKRCQALTAGTRDTILAVMLVSSSGVWLCRRALNGLEDVLTARTSTSTTSLWIEWGLALALLAIENFPAIVRTVVYHDLRVGREGTDTDQLVRVFE